MIGGVKKIFFAATAALLLVANIAAPVLAIQRTTREHSIGNDVVQTVGDLYLTNIRFVDLTDTTSQGFGLIGDAKNAGSRDLEYTSAASYYDSNKTLVASSVHTGKVNANESVKFIQMSSPQALVSGHKASEIATYRLDVSIEYIEDEDEDEYYAMAKRIRRQAKTRNTKQKIMSSTLMI